MEVYFWAARPVDARLYDCERRAASRLCARTTQIDRVLNNINGRDVARGSAEKEKRRKCSQTGVLRNGLEGVIGVIFPTMIFGVVYLPQA